MSGDYRMPRGWMNHPAFGGQREPFCRRSAFAWLVEEARYADQEKADGLSQSCLKRGQVGHSLRFMAKAWGWDDSKVRRFLKKLQDAKLIDCVIDAGQTVITICNYGVFSPLGRVGDAPIDAVSTQHRRSSDANYKEGKKEDKEEESPLTPPGEGSDDPEPELFGGGQSTPERGKRQKPAPLFSEAQMTELFGQFMEAYPHRDKPHSAKGARRIFAAALKRKVDPAAIIAAAARYCNETKAERKIGTVYVKDAYNWLNESRWENYNGVHLFPSADKPDGGYKFEGDKNNPPVGYDDAPTGTRKGWWCKTSRGWNRYAS